MRISRQAYAEIYGPTVGDRVRLADTELWIEVEKDLTVYGEEVTFGGGKVIRDGMGQSQLRSDKVADTVITNALIVDHWGIVKADIGIKHGRIWKIGKAGNPDIQPGVTIPIGAGTEAVAAEGMIVTAGGIDSHAHFICPQRVEEALTSGITTMLGGGTGPASGTFAGGCTPGPWHIRSMLAAADAFPMNLGFYGKGNASLPAPLEEQVRAGAMGLKLHEDWGSTPAAIDNCLAVADKTDVQVAIRVDSLNESGFVEAAVRAFDGRTLQAEGAGDVPDILRVCGEPNVLPSSATGLRTDAGDILHDLGALSMMASGAQATGRGGEVIVRTWQTAHKMKLQRGPLQGDAEADNSRVRRYISKYTINPAVTHGISHVVGSVEEGKLADLVLWKPAFFGVKPSLIVKGGMIAAAAAGGPDASTPAPQPVRYRPMFGAFGRALLTSVTFVSQAALKDPELRDLGLAKPVMAVAGTRRIGKRDMVHNALQPKIEVDPGTGQARADGELLVCEPAKILPMAQRYFLF